MNRPKSKENLNPNLPLVNKRDQNQPKKTRNQSKPANKQMPDIPQRTPIKPNLKQEHPKADPKPGKPAKPHHKKTYLPAEIYYEDEVINYANEVSSANFQQSKLIDDNKIYRNYRENLLESTYRDCVAYGLKRQTFYLYVHYLDTFMKTSAGRRLTLQQTMTASYACFFMAQKYEEIYPPSIYDWVPEKAHEQVYNWEGRIIFALNFKLIHESMHYFLMYWVHKLQLKEEEQKRCMMILESIAFNQEFLHKYEPHKIAKSVVLLELSSSKRSQKAGQLFDPFQSSSEKCKIISDISKHINKQKKRINWISNLRT